MNKRRSKKSAGRRSVPAVTTEPEETWKQRSSSVLWLKLNFTIKAARLQTLKRQKYQHLQEEALLKARGLLKNWEDGPVVLTEDLFSRARSEHEAQEILNYTPEALALRFSLRNHPDVINAVKQLWSVELSRDEMGCIDQRGYASLFRRIGRSLEPDATKRRLRRMEKTIQEDWIRDSKGESIMSFSTFFDSVFELADLWCETIDVEEYIIFLRRLVLRVSTMRSNKRDPNDEGRRMLRSLKQIKAIDVDEVSSSDSDSLSEIDDEAELPSEGDSDSDSEEEDEEEENTPIQLPPPVSPIRSMGFIATKLLKTVRPKTPSSSVGPPQDVTNTSDILEDRPRSRERRASIITLGDFNIGGFSGFPGSDKETEPKTPTGLRVSSAKSRATSAKTPLSSVRENGITASTKDDGGVGALMVMERVRSAQSRVPVVVEDNAVSNMIPNNSISLNVGLPMASLPQQRQQRPAKFFTAAINTPKTSLGTGSINSDGLPASSASGGLLRGTSTSSAPHLKTTERPNAGPTFGNVDNARVGSGGARRTMLSSSTKSKQKGVTKPVGIMFDDAPQINKNYKRLAALGVPSSGTSSLPQSSNQDIMNKKAITIGSIVDGDDYIQSPFNDTESAAQAPREYISGFGYDTAGAGLKDAGNPTMFKKAELKSVNSTLPFYTFDEGASPAKRLLPPVQDDTGGGRSSRSGACSGKIHRQGSVCRDGDGNEQGLDFTGSYKTTGYLTGSLQAQIVAQNRRSVSNSRNTDGRSLQQGATPLWLSLPGKAPCKRSTSNQTPKRMRKSPDDGDVSVSPWDTEFDHEHDNDDLAKAVPRENVSTIPMATASISPIARLPDNSKVQPQEDLDPEPPTLSVSSSMIPPEPPSCVSELTTLPQEYHELVLGGSAFNNYKGLSRAESAPVTIKAPTLIHLAKKMSREPQWMLNGASQPSRTLLEDGVEGRTVTGSPRPVLTALASKRPRRENELDDEEETGLCPRFVEHLDARAATAPSRLFRTDKTKLCCTCHHHEEGEGYDESSCPRHGSGNNRQEGESDEEFIPIEKDNEMNSHVEDVTVIVNATRGLVLRPGTMDKLAAKRARCKQKATRSEMMRRRCQYTFAKHLD